MLDPHVMNHLFPHRGCVGVTQRPPAGPCGLEWLAANSSKVFCKSSVTTSNTLMFLLEEMWLMLCYIGRIGPLITTTNASVTMVCVYLNSL